MRLLVLLMGIAGITCLVGLFLGVFGIINFTTNHMIFLGVLTTINLVPFTIEANKGT